MNTYKVIVNDYKRRYDSENGESKYKKIVEKIRNSKTFASALSQSKNNNHALLAGDFKIISDAALSFLSGPRTAIMGQLIALDIWNDRCNTNFRFLNENELVRVADSCVASFGKSYS
jgi:hypothetical protein